MTSLDDKLNEIIQSGQPSMRAVDDMVGEVTQAFKEAGWIEKSKPFDAAVQYNDHFYFAGDMNVFREVNGLMTGQEWYERFEDGLKDLFGTPNEMEVNGHTYYLEREILEAAKKASGIE